MHLTHAALLIASSLALGACAPAPPAQTASERQCFHVDQVTGFSPAGGDQVYIHAGPGDTWLFETVACPDLDFSLRLGLDTQGASRWICRGLDVDLIAPSPVGPRRCPVRMIRKLSEAESRAL